MPTEVATTPTAQPSPAGALEEHEGPKEVACQTPTSLRGRIESMLGVSKPVPVAVGSRVELKLRPSRGGREAALVKGVVRWAREPPDMCVCTVSKPPAANVLRSILAPFIRPVSAYVCPLDALL